MVKVLIDSPRRCFREYLDCLRAANVRSENDGHAVQKDQARPDHCSLVFRTVILSQVIHPRSTACWKKMVDGTLIREPDAARA